MLCCVYELLTYSVLCRVVQVAVKTLFCIELTHEKVVEFCDEAGLLNALKHDNILFCNGVAVMPPAICLVSLAIVVLSATIVLFGGIFQTQ